MQLFSFHVFLMFNGITTYEYVVYWNGCARK